MRTVALMESNQKIIGLLKQDSDTPADPHCIMWRDNAFIAFGGNVIVPGHPEVGEAYIRATTHHAPYDLIPV